MTRAQMRTAVTLLRRGCGDDEVQRLAGVTPMEVLWLLGGRASRSQGRRLRVMQPARGLAPKPLLNENATAP